MPQEGSFPSQAADFKSATQLKTLPPTDILQKPHPDVELYLYVLEIREHLFFKKLAVNGCLLKKKKKKTITKNKQVKSKLRFLELKLKVFRNKTTVPPLSFED